MNSHFCSPVCEDHDIKENKTTCTWIWFDDGTYVSECDHEFYATEGDDLNWMNFCPYCGKLVVTQGGVEDID